MNYPIILALNLTKNPQNRCFCALLGSGTAFFGCFEHKIGIFVSEWAIFPVFCVVLSTKSGFLCAFCLQDPRYLAFRAQNRHFCVRMGDFSEIFGRFDTKMGFLCSGREVIGTGKRNRFLPANHRARFQNANAS